MQLRLNLPLLSLVAVNVLPLIGVVYWNWSLSTILWLYWFESFFVGAFNIPKIALSTGPVKRKVKTVFFFVIHYGGFWLAHGFFLLIKLIPEVEQNAVLGNREINTEFDIAIKWVLLSLFASHLVSFLLNFIQRDKSLIISPEAQMFVPYGRVVILHILILGGGYLAAKFGTSLVILGALICMKTVLDAFLHVKTNRLYKAPKPDT